MCITWAMKLINFYFSNAKSDASLEKLLSITISIALRKLYSLVLILFSIINVETLLCVTSRHYLDTKLMVFTLDVFDRCMDIFI